MQGRDGIARAVYAAVQDRRLLVLHVFVKKNARHATKCDCNSTQTIGRTEMKTLQSLKA